MLRTMVLVVLAFAMVAVAYGNDIVQAPTLQAVRAAVAPALDGKLDEDCWEQAPVAGNFMLLDGSGPASQATEVRIAYDDDNLYVGWYCHEEDTSRLPREAEPRDVYTAGAGVELFLDTNRDRETYFHFVVNAANTYFDEFVMDARWDCPTRYATHIGEDFWSVEMAIPFAAVGVGPQTANEWRVEFGRSDAAAGKTEYSAWSPTYGIFHTPNRFGMLTDLQVDWSPFFWTMTDVPREIGLGQPVGRISLHNSTGAPFQGSLTATLISPSGEEHSQEVPLAGKGQRAVDIDQKVQQTGRHTLRVALKATDGALRFWGQWQIKGIPVVQLRTDQRFYSSEKTGHIIVNLNTARPVAGVLALRVRRAEGGERIAASDVPNPSAGEHRLTFDVDEAGVGDYVASAVLREDGRAAGRARHEFVVREPVPGEVNTDPRGGLVIDGQPFFPIGWYYFYGVVEVDKALAEQAAQAGFNALVLEWDPPAGYVGWLQRYQELGYRAILGVASCSTVWDSPPARKDAAVQRLVSEIVKAAPANVLAWYTVDEPTPPDQTPIRRARLIRKLDPAHPTLVCCHQTPHFAYYTPSHDILTLDPYPGTFPRDEVLKVARHQKAAVEAVGPSGTTINVIQSFYPREGGGQMPSPQALRAMTYLAIVHGAKGILYFSYSWNGNMAEKHPETWQALLDLASEMRELTEVILAPPPRKVSARLQLPAEVDFMLREYHGDIYVFLVNPRAKVLGEVTLKFESLARARAEAVFSGEQAQIEAGILTTRLEGYGVKVFRITGFP